MEIFLNSFQFGKFFSPESTETSKVHKCAVSLLRLEVCTKLLLIVRQDKMNRNENSGTHKKFRDRLPSN